MDYNRLIIFLSIVSISHALSITSYVLKLRGEPIEIRNFTDKHDLQLVHKINDSDGYYVLRHGTNRHKRELELDDHPLIEWYERELPLNRHKRGIPTHDPLYNESWYLNRHLFTSLPDMNVTNAWKQGYSGKGVRIVVVDDGLEHSHPDLKDNYDPLCSWDFNNNDNDPMPRYDEKNENKHGTRVAGVIAAVKNNGVCSTGIAYKSNIGGIRLLDGLITDSFEAFSFGFKNDYIDIYSASWGPSDNGEVVEGPNRLTRMAFKRGTETGRNGKGSIYVWAAGNGGHNDDSCACDGYTSSIYTFSISSTTEKGEVPGYLEECASILAATYSSGNQVSHDRSVVSTDLHQKCTKSLTGTSAAAPIAAGIFALVLEANQNLTWRDMMYLTVVSSRSYAIKSNRYTTNKAGLNYSTQYGFGLMDAGKMTQLAVNWTNVPRMQTCIATNFKFYSNRTKYFVESYLMFNNSNCLNLTISNIEQIEAVLSVSSEERGALSIILVSPLGTKSNLLKQRSKDKSSDGFSGWSFRSLQFWGENPIGLWRLQISTKFNMTSNFH